MPKVDRDGGVVGAGSVWIRPLQHAGQTRAVRVADCHHSAAEERAARAAVPDVSRVRLAGYVPAAVRAFGVRH